ncbi:MAG: glycosyltransferase [Pedobacter sp.]
MKVLHITSYITGGAGIAVMRLHNALLDSGIDSKVLCYFSMDENLSKEVYTVNSRKSFITKSKERFGLDRKGRLLKGLTGNYEAFTTPFSEIKLHEHELVKNADIIHLHWVGDFVDVPSFFENVKKPVVWTAHDLNPILGGFHYEQDVARNPTFKGIEDKLRTLKHKYINEAKVQFIGSSKFTVEKVSEYLPGISCLQIPCILDLKNYSPIEKSIAKTALRFGDEHLVLGVGADDLENKRKGYRILMDAIGKLTIADQQCIKLVTFGNAKDNGANQNPTIQTVRFETIKNKLFHSLLYSALDFFVIPSLEETFGLTGTEALLCNTPLLGSKTGGVPDYCEDQVSGLLFSPGAVDELHLKLKEVLDLKKQGQTAFPDCARNILDWYNQEDPVNRHIQLYKNLVS